ncbi:unnamed protein product [Pleuronectes platessa]|uniref:Ashwin n=1 Tax=Pleuronectes platessa TaxID=8262 RepID=A0A9N7VP20_PLEPL|nr:unnamed protein product [Pleuronectes platessa]
MAASIEHGRKAVGSSDVDLLLHPELLSQDFMQLILTEKRVSTKDCGSRDRLTELYLRHVIPLPQRTLPDSRWGRRVQRSRGPPDANSSSNDHKRKRPLIVFDSRSSHSGALKVRKPEGTTASTGITDSTDTANLKREANSSVPLESPEVKKKIHHVTWP